MRYEAKNHYFKRWAWIMGNFKISLAHHHQTHLLPVGIEHILVFKFMAEPGSEAHTLNSKALLIMNIHYLDTLIDEEVDENTRHSYKQLSGCDIFPLAILRLKLL